MICEETETFGGCIEKMSGYHSGLSHHEVELILILLEAFTDVGTESLRDLSSQNGNSKHDDDVRGPDTFV